MREKPRVLFLCSDNAVRSQLAEAILERDAGALFTVASAGLEPQDVHPLTRRVLAEIGIDASRLRAKPITEFLGKFTVSYAIILSDHDETAAPRVYPFSIHTLHWPLQNPARAGRDAEGDVACFRGVRDQLEARIRAWLEELSPRDTRPLAAATAQPHSPA